MSSKQYVVESRRVSVMTTAAVVKVMTLLSPFSQWEFSVSEETGNSLFYKDVYSPSIFLGRYPLPSQVFRFALASSCLAILSARSTVE